MWFFFFFLGGEGVLRMSSAPLVILTHSGLAPGLRMWCCSGPEYWGCQATLAVFEDSRANPVTLGDQVVLGIKLGSGACQASALSTILSPAPACEFEFESAYFWVRVCVGQEEGTEPAHLS